MTRSAPRIALAALLVLLPLLAALTYAFSHRPASELSTHEISWASAVLLALPLAFAATTAVALPYLRAPASRVLVAVSLPVLSGSAVLILSSHYVLDHLIYGNTGSTAYLGALAADLDRARRILALASGGCASAGIIAAALLRGSKDVPQGAFAFALLRPSEWTLSLLSNGSTAVLLASALVLTSLVLVIRMPYASASR